MRQFMDCYFGSVNIQSLDFCTLWQAMQPSTFPTCMGVPLSDQAGQKHLREFSSNRSDLNHQQAFMTQIPQVCPARLEKKTF